MTHKQDKGAERGAGDALGPSKANQLLRGGRRPPAVRYKCSARPARGAPPEALERRGARQAGTGILHIRRGARQHKAGPGAGRARLRGSYCIPSAGRATARPNVAWPAPGRRVQLFYSDLEKDIVGIKATI